MSAFLGPIHYWLHGKIRIQNDIVEDILDLVEKDYNLNYREYLDNEYGKIETKPLEEVIDESNIHGWLQERINIVEKRLAYAVTNILKEKPEVLDKLKEIYRSNGIRQFEQSQLNSDSTASELYKAAVNDSLLDGMPCDHVNSVSSQEEGEITWKRGLCVHEEFWNQVEGDTSVYYTLRDEYINGFLENARGKYEKIDDSTFKISK